MKKLLVPILAFSAVFGLDAATIEKVVVRQRTAACSHRPAAGTDGPTGSGICPHQQPDPENGLLQNKMNLWGAAVAAPLFYPPKDCKSRPPMI